MIIWHNMIHSLVFDLHQFTMRSDKIVQRIIWFDLPPVSSMKIIPYSRQSPKNNVLGYIIPSVLHCRNETVYCLGRSRFKRNLLGPAVINDLFMCLCNCCRSKYFRNRKVFGDWDLRVEQVTYIVSPCEWVSKWTWLSIAHCAMRSMR